MCKEWLKRCNIAGFEDVGRGEGGNKPRIVGGL